MSKLRDNLISMELWEPSNLGDPSTDAKSAMILMGKVSALGFFWSLGETVIDGGGKAYYAGVRMEPVKFTVGCSEAVTLPRAICEAVVDARHVIEIFMDIKRRQYSDDDL